MADRTIEDRLREEYFELLPEIGRVRQQLESEIRYYTRLISCRLDKYQRLQVTSRVKECGSAVDALRRRQESRIFDPDEPIPILCLRFVIWRESGFLHSLKVY